MIVSSRGDDWLTVTIAPLPVTEEHPWAALPPATSAEARKQKHWLVPGRNPLLGRRGRVELGEVLAVAAVSAPHQVETSEAPGFLIGSVKVAAGVWKRETWTGGCDWCVRGDRGSKHETGPGPIPANAEIG